MSGARSAGDGAADIVAFISTSDFGAAPELDRRVCTRADRAYITVVAPDYNFDPDRIDAVGGGSGGEITVATR